MYKLSLFIVLSYLLLVSSGSFAEDKNLAEGIVGQVGEAIGGTVKGVGGTVKGIGEAVMPNTDLAAARLEIDKNASTALQRLLKSNSAARMLYDKSYGYAVFDSRKISLMMTTGGGSGVVVEKSANKRTYMRMATVGAGLGYGAQFFNVIFLFENKNSLQNFVEQGWEANAAATAVFGKNSMDTNARFVQGLAVYQLNESGIMADLNLTGTRYWQSAELNKLS